MTVGFVMPHPSVLQEHHFIQSVRMCSHDGSQDFWEDTHPLHLWDYQVSLSPLPDRNLSLPLLLWASSQPEGVAEPRGTMDVGGGDGMLSRHQTFSLLPLWDSYPQGIYVRGLTPSVLAPVLSLQVFDPTRFAPGSTRHSHAFLPFSGGSR